MSAIRLTTVAFIAAFCSSCAESPPLVEEKAQFDRSVEQDLIPEWRSVDALVFLKQGGTYTDTGDPNDSPMDRSQILPLLERLGRMHQLRWRALVDKKTPQFAVAVLAELPQEAANHKDIFDAIMTEQNSFPGSILVQFGYKWLSIDFLRDGYAEKVIEDPGKS